MLNCCNSSRAASKPENVALLSMCLDGARAGLPYSANCFSRRYSDLDQHPRTDRASPAEAAATVHEDAPTRAQKLQQARTDGGPLRLESRIGRFDVDDREMVPLNAATLPSCDTWCWKWTPQIN